MRWPLAISLLAVAGCGTVGPVNRSFPVTLERAAGILHYDADHPRPLRRPVVVIGGFMDPGWAAPRLRDRIRRWTGDDRVIAVSLGFATSFDQCRRDIVAAVDQAFPSGDPSATVPVDVIGISMGGLAARFAALPAPRRLRIDRLFTISAPLQGAVAADAVPFDLHPLLAAMRSDSWLCRRLNDGCGSLDDAYAVYAYVRLGDRTVGAAHAGVPGVPPWWVAPPVGQPPHDAAYTDPRILADIVCRLRGEPPLAHEPPAPLPEHS